MPGLLGRAFFLLAYIRFLVVSFLVVSVLVVPVPVLSVVAGAIVAAESFLALVLSELPVFFSELQPAAIEPIMVATNAKLKICFFIDIELVNGNLCC
jgi:hypothetical protein